MPALRSGVVFALGVTCCLALPLEASAQFYPSGPQSSPMGTPWSSAGAPLNGTGNPCYCVQPTTQMMYQTVPVTEYRQVKQTVKRPVYDTQYVDQPVTEYRPVVEQRTMDVPTVTYQEVTECQEVQRNAGYWQTNAQPNYRMPAWQYDNRCSVMGHLNRTGYRLRSMVAPRYTVQRNYVPQVVSQMVPTVRRIPIHETRQVAYNVTRMEPMQTTRRVAMNTVRYVDEEVTAMQPVTVMRQVAVGARTAYSYVPSQAATRTALQPSPDPVSGAKKETPKRTADSTNDAFGPQSSLQPSNSEDLPVQGASLSVPVRDSSAAPRLLDRTRAEVPNTVNNRSVPSIVRLGGWRPRVSQVATGPELAPPQITLAEHVAR